MLTAITLIVVIALLVFVHEAGHFIAAKKSGMRVDEFGFGFPPRLFGFKRGETMYSINWIPLGGFVKIKGESGEDRDDKDSFGARPLWQRAHVLIAGVFMNITLAWVLFTIGYIIGMPQLAEELSPYARVSQPEVRVMSVLPGSPADRAGLMPGDAIVAVDGSVVTDTPAVRDRTSMVDGAPIALGIDRSGERLEFAVTPETLAETGRQGIGVALARTGLVSYAWYLAPLQAASAVWNLSLNILSAFGSLLRDLFVGQKVTQEFSGPVGIAFITADVAREGIRHLLQFTALLSLNLAIINVLPFPALDGGRLAFLFVEAVRGQAASRRLEIAAHNIGFAILMLLVLVVTYRDLIKYGARILGAFGA
jgi:regulator of sigma E protease